MITNFNKSIATSLKFLTLGALMTLQSGCAIWYDLFPRQGSAKVLCGDLQHAETEFGLINPGGKLRFGQLLGLDPVSHRAEPLALVVPSPSQIADATPSTTVDHIKSSTLTVQADATIPASVTAQLESTLAASTEFKITDGYSQQIKDPIGLINNDPTALSRASQAKSDILLIVYKIYYAKDVSIAIKNDTTVDGSVKVKVAEYSISVKYDCAEDLHQSSASGAPMFWAAVEAKYDPTSGKIVPDSTAYDISGYNLSAAITH